MNILVTGGTGTVGSEVVSRLIERGVSPRVLTRSPDQAREEGPEEASYVGGDLADPTSLEGAFAKMEKVFLLTPNRPDEVDLGRTAVAAADRAGVDHVVFISIYRAEEIPEATHFAAKIEIGNALRERGLAHTEIRASSFYQNDLWFRSEIVEQGIYPQPLGRIGVSRVDTRDVADASVNALLEAGHAGEIYPVLGPTPMTGPEIAARWSKALGTDVRYGGDDLDAWAEQARRRLPASAVEDLRRMYRHMQDHGWVASAEEVDRQREVLDREPGSFDNFVQEVASMWRG